MAVSTPQLAHFTVHYTGVDDRSEVDILKCIMYLKNLMNKYCITNVPSNCLTVSCLLKCMTEKMNGVFITIRVGYLVGNGQVVRHVWNDYYGLCIDCVSEYPIGTMEYMSTLPPNVYKFDGFDIEFEGILSRYTSKSLIKAPLRDVNGARIYYIAHIVSDCDQYLDYIVETDPVWKLAIKHLKDSKLM